MTSHLFSTHCHLQLQRSSSPDCHSKWLAQLEAISSLHYAAQRRSLELEGCEPHCNFVKNSVKDMPKKRSCSATAKVQESGFVGRMAGQTSARKQLPQNRATRKHWQRDTLSARGRPCDSAKQLLAAFSLVAPGKFLVRIRTFAIA